MATIAKEIVPKYHVVLSEIELRIISRLLQGIDLTPEELDVKIELSETVADFINEEV